MKRGLALLALLPPTLLAAPAEAAFVPPAGCEVHLTVQSRQCRVSNHYTCTGDPKGDQWRVDLDQEGAFFFSRINAEAEWVESFGMEVGSRQTLAPGAKDPASFSALLDGYDSYDFWLEHEDGSRTHVTGHDRLTGESSVIDGITLPQTSFEFLEVDEYGNTVRQSRGQEFIHPEWRRFFSGPSEFLDVSGDFLPLDGSPVEFIFPGEPGFAASQPLFDCDPMMSQLQPQRGPA